MTYRSLGYRYAIDAVEPLHSALREALGALRIDDAANDDAEDVLTIRAVGGGWTLEATTHSTTARTPGEMLAKALEHINQRAAASVTDAVPLHAATVVHPSGTAIALAGTSGAGKSTLGLAATLAGWKCHAEEISAVESSVLRVRPYHRPIGLRRGGAALLRLDYPTGAGSSPGSPASDVYSEVFPRPIPADRRSHTATLTGVAILGRHAGAAGTTPLRPAAAMAALMEHIVIPHDDRLVTVFTEVEQIVRLVPVVRLNPGTPGIGVEQLERLVAEWRTDPT